MNVSEMNACFTEKARKVMELSKSEAQRFNHEHIGTEHMLLGILKESTSMAAQLLHKKVDLRKVRLAIEKVMMIGPDMVTNQLPYTPRAKQVLQYALDEARSLRSGCGVDVEHLLLGMMREEESMAAKVLFSLGFRNCDFRRDVIAESAARSLVGAAKKETEDIYQHYFGVMAGDLDLYQKSHIAALLTIATAMMTRKA
jgi:ATP-dependent Clp protease ATP-binding subunit ClpC